MNSKYFNEELHGMDLSLFDQLLKGRFDSCRQILDAGFGGGRNSLWFVKNGFDVHGVDQNEEAVHAFCQKLQEEHIQSEQFIESDLINLPYHDMMFDAIICNAVLHFASSHAHFQTMLAELVRVLKKSGILFIRMTSDIGVADRLDNGQDGVYLIPDGSYRYLLTRAMLNEIMIQHNLQFVEPLKTVNVNDVRCMSTLVLRKEF